MSRVAGSMIQAHLIGGRPIQMVGRLGDFALRHRCLCSQLLAGSTTDVMSITASLNLSTCCAAQIVCTVGGADFELTQKGSFDLLGRFCISLGHVVPRGPWCCHKLSPSGGLLRHARRSELWPPFRPFRCIPSLRVLPRTRTHPNC